MEAWPAHPDTWDLPAFWVSRTSEEHFILRTVCQRESEVQGTMALLGSYSQGQSPDQKPGFLLLLPAPAPTQLALTPELPALL